MGTLGYGEKPQEATNEVAKEEVKVETKEEPSCDCCCSSEKTTPTAEESGE